MVKRVLTSIITVAVLMGSLIACGGSENTAFNGVIETGEVGTPPEGYALFWVDF